jgi:arylsulfatase A
MYRVLAIFITLAAGLACKATDKTVQVVKPNIVFILADDLGYGDIGVYGQEKIETPNLDALAKGGMLFTQHYSGTTVCAPSRAALMTGLHTGHTPIRGNFEVVPEGQFPMPDTVLTLPKMLQQAGYVTGAFGKWGLGMVGTTGDPNNQGIDTFFGYNCQRQAHRYFPEYLWHNDEKTLLDGNDWNTKQTYAPDLIHKESLKFIESKRDKPFLLYVPMIMPHAELAVAEDAVFHKYRSKFGEENPYQAPPGHDYGPGILIPGYQSVAHPRATYAAMVEMLDRQVGELVQQLKAQGIYEQTLIVFSSDNGPHQEGGNDPDFFNSNGDLRGYKRDLYEGGIRVPLIMHWAGKILAGSRSDHISAFWDLMPTFADVAGATPPKNIDGISLMPTLTGKKQEAHTYLYWEFVDLGGRQAIRKGNWKAVKYDLRTAPGQPMELYRLDLDPSESNNIAANHPEVTAAMEKLFKEAHWPNPQFPLFK